MLHYRIQHTQPQVHVSNKGIIPILYFLGFLFSTRIIFPFHYYLRGSPVAQVVRLSLSSAGVLSLHLGRSMSVLWWTKLSLVRFFSGFLLFSPCYKLNSTFSPHSSHSFHFISSSLWWCIRHGQLASCYLQFFNKMASLHLIPRPSPVLKTYWYFCILLLFTYVAGP